MSAVHPVAMRKAVFWIVCSLFKFVSAVIGDQIVLAYSITGLVSVLYVFSIVSFCFPHFVDVSALMILRDLSALSFVFCTCLL